ncbi:MAG: aquaporin [Chloroflexota bacterium]|nr:aquaporin [Chloroflexota bacterium]
MVVMERGDESVRPIARRDETEQDKYQSHGKPEREASLSQRLFAEVFGTFALVTVAAGADVIAVISAGEVNLVARAVAPALLVMAMIYAIGDVSGAHFNPAVTLAFALRRDFPWRLVPAYWAAELAGALCAAVLLRTLYGDVGHLGANQPNHGVGVSLVMEIVLTLLLITVILGTATRHQLIGPNAAIAVGGTIALCGLFALPVSGASMNPVRSLGPALIGNETAYIWIYLVGPLLGSVLAVAATWVMHGGRKTDEENAAGGDGAQGH